MLDTEGQWSKALANNSIRAIIHWLQSLTAEGLDSNNVGDADVEDNLATFSCWVQRTSEFAKKELRTLCFSRCQGLWMFLDQSSFTRVHLLLQRLRNLITLAQWGRRQLSSAHLWHGVGVPCVVCREVCGTSEIEGGCWNREHRALKQHIWLGRLVQWWGTSGLLSKYPEAHEVKRISQMWREMDHSHRKTCLETPGWEESGMERWSTFIQGMVAQLDKQHGCIWMSEDYPDQCYPPPSLQALLKLVLVPRIDNMSVQAVLMYFVLDMANFLQCKDDLLQSFCQAFTIPSSFSQQIRAFWMLDHGHVKASMELLLSPRAAAPWLSWQHRCTIHSLLTRKQPRMALRYLYWSRPAMESLQDVKLCADVLLQNSCVSEAWALLRKGHTESDDMVKYFLQTCKGLGLSAEALQCMPAGYNGEDGNALEANSGIENVRKPIGTQLSVENKDCLAGRPPCPLSARLYQAQKMKTLSSEELVKLLRKAVVELRKSHPRISEVVWPEHREKKRNEVFLSTQALRHLLPSPVDMDDGTEQLEHTGEPEEEQPLIYNQQPETSDNISSSEDLSSEFVSSFTSASSTPQLRRDHLYVYESTLTLQRISALLTDEENQSREEEESRAPSAADASPDCPDLTATLDGATDPVSFNSLNKDGVEELVLSAEWEEEEVMTEDFLTVDTVASMDEDLPLDKRSRGRLNLPPQFYSNEDNQSVPFLFEPQEESHNFLSPDYEKMDYCKGISEEIIQGPPNSSDLRSAAPSVHQEDQSECGPTQMFTFSEAAASHCFLELESLRRACEPLQLEESVECLCRDSRDAMDQPEILTSCALFETAQDLLGERHHSLLLEEMTASGSDAVTYSAGVDEQNDRGAGRHGRPFSGSLSPRTSPTHNTEISSAPPDNTAHEKSSKASPMKEAACFLSTSDRLDHCMLGGWWKQGLETRRASMSLLPARDQVPAITSEKRASLVLSQPHFLSLGNYESTSKQKGDKRDGKQADKEEPAGRRSPGKTSYQRAELGATGQCRTRPRKGKRVKKA